MYDDADRPNNGRRDNLKKALVFLAFLAFGVCYGQTPTEIPTDTPTQTNTPTATLTPGNYFNFRPAGTPFDPYKHSPYWKGLQQSDINELPERLTNIERDGFTRTVWTDGAGDRIIDDGYIELFGSDGSINFSEDDTYTDYSYMDFDSITLIKGMNEGVAEDYLSLYSTGNILSKNWRVDSGAVSCVSVDAQSLSVQTKIPESMINISTATPLPTNTPVPTNTVVPTATAWTTYAWSNFVPYSGAISDVNMNAKSITNVNSMSASSVLVSSQEKLASIVRINSVVQYDYTSAITQMATGPSAKYIWHDLLSFSRFWGSPSCELYDGVNWNAVTNTYPSLFSLKTTYSEMICDGVTNTGVRMTWNSSNVNCSMTFYWMIAIPYTGTVSVRNYLIETSSDGVTWVTRHTSSGNTETLGRLPIINLLYAANGCLGNYIRLTITVTNGVPLYLSQIRALSARLSGQGGGSEYEFPYTWDSSRNIGLGAASTYSGLLNLGSNSTTTSTGGIYWGNDTNLYRPSANELKTDDGFSANHFVVSTPISNSYLLLWTPTPVWTYTPVPTATPNETIPAVQTAIADGFTRTEYSEGCGGRIIDNGSISTTGECSGFTSQDAVTWTGNYGSLTYLSMGMYNADFSEYFRVDRDGRVLSTFWGVEDGAVTCKSIAVLTPVPWSMVEKPADGITGSVTTLAPGGTTIISAYVGGLFAGITPVP